MTQNQEQQVTMTMQWNSPISEVLSNPLYARFLAPPKLESTPIVSIAEQDGEKGVRLCVGDIDIFIEAHDLDDGKEYEWPDAMKRLKKVGKKTFNKHQSYLIAAFKYEINEKMREIGGKELNCAYWSSTELNSYSAWNVNFSNGDIDYYLKTGAFSVRPVAAFKKKLRN